jgi:CoA:oxalate CoA-transferase
MIVESFDPDPGAVRMHGNPIKLSSYDDPSTRGAAPDLNADRAAILKALEL